jgi:hypothetical protein
MKRLFTLRFFVKLTVGLLVLCLIGVGVENWTGASALAKAREDFMREGEVLDFASLKAKPIPAAENFFAIEPLDGISAPRKGEESPLHGKLRSLDWAAGAFEKHPKARHPNLYGGCATSEPLDVHNAAAFLSEVSYIDTAPDADAAQILAAIDRLHPLLKELSDAAVDRPEACFDHSAALDHAGAPYKRPSPYLNGAVLAAKGLAMRAQMAVIAGDQESAVRSIQASMRFTQALGQEPQLLALLSASCTAPLELNSIWLLLHRHAASPAQLARVQADLERLDFRRFLFQTTRGEMVWQMESIEWYKGHRDDLRNAYSQLQMLNVQTEPAWLASAAVYMLPTGWFDHNEANALRLGSTYLLEPVMNHDGREMIRGFERMENLVARHRETASPHHRWSVLGFPSYPLIIRPTIYCEALRRQCLAAIAIERYRLTHAKLPLALRDLMPEFLSAVAQDIMDSVPIRYRVEGEGTFVLWSIGWDGKDDGGKRPNGKEAKRAFEPNYVGDWVWKN